MSMRRREAKLKKNAASLRDLSENIDEAALAKLMGDPSIVGFVREWRESLLPPSRGEEPSAAFALTTPMLVGLLLVAGQRDFDGLARTLLAAEITTLATALLDLPLENLGRGAERWLAQQR